MNSKHFSLIALAAAGTLFSGVSRLQASDIDNRIEASAKNSFVFRTYLKDDSITTDSKDGAVTLTGNVGSAENRSLAADTVESLPGVKSVDNQIRVRGEAPAEHSDAWIGTKVRTTLLFHRNVSMASTDVSVSDGVVSLRGEASSQAQKDLTAEYAGDVDGVKTVKNEMTVAREPSKQTRTTGDKIDDASITAQVKSSLLSHRSTSALKTHVETTDGVVTVSGVAKNAAEKSLVTKLVSDINGVLNVINTMTIAVPVVRN